MIKISIKKFTTNSFFHEESESDIDDDLSQERDLQIRFSKHGYIPHQ